MSPWASVVYARISGLTAPKRKNMAIPPAVWPAACCNAADAALQLVVAVGVLPEGKIHRVDPKFAS